MELLQPILDRVIQRNPDDKEFIQAVTEVFTSLEPVAEKHPEYIENGIFERIVEPERQIIFRVPWGRLTIGKSTGQPRIPRGIQFRDRPLQRRPAFPPVRKHQHHQIPRILSRSSKTR